MSQWGAYGFAQRGTPYDQLLAHYYRSTTLGKAPVARVPRAARRRIKALAVASDSPFSVRDGSGAVYKSSRRPTFGPALKLKVDYAQPAKLLTAPLDVLPGATPLKYGGKQYRGQLQVNACKTSLQLVNSVGLEPYLYGVVPREVPFLSAGRGAEGAGRRRALVRTRGAQDRRVRPLRRHAQPGVRRRRRRKADDEHGGRRDCRPGAAIRGQGRDHVLLLDLWRTHRVDRGRLGARRGGPLPRWRARPVRQRVAAPQLGTVRVHREADLDLQVPGQAARRARNAQPVAARRRPQPREHEGRGRRPGRRRPHQAGRRSTWFRVGVLALETPP